MIEICWRYDENQSVPPDPATAQEALFTLRSGNAAFADLGRTTGDHRYVIPVSAGELGFGDDTGRAPQQTPFAAVLGCADARVPLEMVFSQPANEMFVVRVAGNVTDSACVGSLDYAITQLPSLRVIAVVGHTGCGAVRATADAYLDPDVYLGMAGNLPLRSLVDALMPAVRAADHALRERHGHERAERAGYYNALVDVAVVVNAATGALSMRNIFSRHLSEALDVHFGVYDLATRLIGLPDAVEAWRPGLAAPPTAMDRFVRSVVDSQHVVALLSD